MLWHLYILSLKILALLSPEKLVALIYRFCTSGFSIAICLHRVSNERRQSDPYPPNTIETEKLDKIIKIISPFYENNTETLTLTFDDGYQDSYDYIKKNAPMHPHIEWIFFVCPEKIEKQVGFRWDAYENLDPKEKSEISFSQFISRTNHDEKENEQSCLKRIAQMDAYKIASYDDCKALTEITNTKLGNHTNSHLKLTTFNRDNAKSELDNSFSLFNKLFQKAEHFAFPFGTPKREYTQQHVDIINQSNDVFLWSTFSAPYKSQERQRGKVLPRFAIFGTWSAKMILLIISLKTLGWKMKGHSVTKHLEQMLG